LFDFNRPSGRGFGETVTLLARLARFVVADLTDALEVRSELMQIVPTSPRLPVQPILEAGASAYSTFATDVEPYPWVLPSISYQADAASLDALVERIVTTVESRWRQDSAPTASSG
jgi:hypothetical protein